ncbi:MAG: RDD family protein [Saprospiraceae bacterium]|nr:RDD family protein [Saprospiraceae bacterium]MCB0625004.1 RDD family protein [Saprospiraceae bacterium]MCB0681390.1 RDD family protein [Saprospiraceae bacterium]
MQTIEIRTTQNVTIEYELASLRERIFSFLLDFIFLLIVYYVLVAILFSTIEDILISSGFNLYFVYFYMPVFLFLLYQLASEALAGGQSAGKKLLGIKVVRLDGREPGLTDFLLRAILLIVDVILTFGVVAALLVGSTAKRQRLGDLTANTTVVRVRSQLRFQLYDILKINSLENYQPRYPEVKRLSEQDMLLIKNAVARHQVFQNRAHTEAIDELVKKLVHLLALSERPPDKIDFLKTLIKDYIVLTR